MSLTVPSKHCSNCKHDNCCFLALTCIPYEHRYHNHINCEPDKNRTMILKTFDIIIYPHQLENDQTIEEYVLGFDFSSTPISKEQEISHVDYRSTVEDINIYFCFGSDHYLFTEKLAV